MVDQQDYRNKLDQANAQLSRAQAEYDAAKLTFDRTEALYSSKSATKPEYDSANAQLQSAAAATTTAKAQIDDARIALAYCELRAPFDGWIVDRTVDVGSLVGPATKGFSIANTNSVKAVFGVPDISMHQVTQGQHIKITTEALPQEFNGRVTSICRPPTREPRVLSGSDHSKPTQPVKVRNDRFAFAGRRTTGNSRDCGASDCGSARYSNRRRLCSHAGSGES